MSNQSQFEQWFAQFMEVDPACLERTRYTDEDGLLGYDGLQHEGMTDEADDLASMGLQAWQAARAEGGSQPVMELEVTEDRTYSPIVTDATFDVPPGKYNLYTHPPSKVPEWIKCSERLPEARRPTRQTPNGILILNERGRIELLREVTDTAISYMKHGPRQPTKFEQSAGPKVVAWLDLDERPLPATPNPPTQEGKR